MAKKRLWSLVDDFDGSPAAETVTFALDGRTYEIDLSAENAAELRDVLQPWIDAGRRRRVGPQVRAVLALAQGMVVDVVAAPTAPRSANGPPQTPGSER